MAQEIENQQARRFRPGDMARVVYSKDKTLIGQIVVVEKWSSEFQRWEVRLTAAPALGTSVDTGRPIITSEFLFRDGSLEPLQAKEKAGPLIAHRFATTA